MVNNPLIRLFFWGGFGIRGIPLDSHYYTSYFREIPQNHHRFAACFIHPFRALPLGLMFAPKRGDFNGILKGPGVVIPLIFPKVPQSSL